jgi:hypothetical protein
VRALSLHSVFPLTSLSSSCFNTSRVSSLSMTSGTPVYSESELMCMKVPALKLLATSHNRADNGAASFSTNKMLKAQLVEFILNHTTTVNDDGSVNSYKRAAKKTSNNNTNMDVEERITPQQQQQRRNTGDVKTTTDP